MNQEHIEQYVSGRMSESEAQAFEDYCVANPEFARQVELEQRLKAGIARAARDSTADFVRTHHPLRWQMAAAIAGIVLSLGALFYVWQRDATATARAVLAAVSPDRHRNSPKVRLALVRGESSKPSLQEGLVRVEIAGLYDTQFLYSVALDRIDEKKHIETVATVYGVQPTSPVTLELMIDGDQLAPGSYSLRVRKQTSVEEPLDIDFLKN